jgi:hypothetical protein
MGEKQNIIIVRYEASRLVLSAQVCRPSLVTDMAGLLRRRGLAVRAESSVIDRHGLQDRAGEICPVRDKMSVEDETRSLISRPVGTECDLSVLFHIPSRTGRGRWYERTFSTNMLSLRDKETIACYLFHITRRLMNRKRNRVIVRYEAIRLLFRRCGLAVRAESSLARRSGTLRRAEIFDGPVVRALRATPNQINRSFPSGIARNARTQRQSCGRHW